MTASRHRISYPVIQSISRLRLCGNTSTHVFVHSSTFTTSAPFSNALIFCWFRSSHRTCSVEKLFLEISQNLQENTCARVSFLIKLQRLWRRCFPVSFAKFLRTPFLQNTSGQLLLLIFHTHYEYQFLVNPDFASK